MVIQKIRQLMMQRVAIRFTSRSAVRSLDSSALQPDFKILWSPTMQACGMNQVSAAGSQELLRLRVRLRGVGTIDEETERESINKAGGSTQPIKKSVLRTGATCQFVSGILDMLAATLLAVEESTTSQSLIAEALNLLVARRGTPQIAEP
jgi:Antitoxin-like ribbon-helix-helix